MNLGIIIHISGQDTGKCAQFISTLSKMLQNRGYSTVELLEQHIGENLASTDTELLARTIGWASELLLKTGALVLVSVSVPLSKVLAKFYRYAPAIELTFDEEFMTTAPHHMNLTAETINLPQEIAQLVLLVEKITVSQDASSAKHLADDNVYSAEEEALLEEHLKALGYL